MSNLPLDILSENKTLTGVVIAALFWLLYLLITSIFKRDESRADKENRRMQADQAAQQVLIDHIKVINDQSQRYLKEQSEQCASELRQTQKEFLAAQETWLIEIKSLHVQANQVHESAAKTTANALEQLSSAIQSLNKDRNA